MVNLVSVVNMSAYHLRKTEVEYELKIRNISTDGNAQELRKRLSACLASNTEVDEASVNSLETEGEIEECEQKYQDLSTLVSDYEGSYKDNEFNRIIARLWHLYLRVGRIPIGATADGEEEKTKEQLVKTSKELLDIFKDSASTAQPTPETSSEESSQLQGQLPQPMDPPTSKEDTSGLEEKEENIEERRRLEVWLKQEEEKLQAEKRQQEERWREEDRRLLQERKSKEERWKQEERKLQEQFKKREQTKLQVGDETSANSNQQERGRLSEDRRDSLRPRYVPVYKWGLKFDNNSGHSIAAFLERVEELRRSRGVTHQELYESAVDLFDGSALVWYREATHRIKSWHQLTKELREVFQPADYDFRLHHEIFNRAQGEHESIDLYIAAVEGLYSRLAISVPETTRLAQIYNNLHPQLQDRLALSNIQTLEQLRSMGRRAEAGRLSMTRPRHSYKVDTSLEPDLAYYDPSRRRVAGPAGRVAELKPMSSEERKDVVCWNCRDKGHRFRFCRKPKKRFCYGCGKEDTYKKECASCNPKNVQREEVGPS